MRVLAVGVGVPPVGVPPVSSSMLSDRRWSSACELMRVWCGWCRGSTCDGSCVCRCVRAVSVGVPPVGAPPVSTLRGRRWSSACELMRVRVVASEFHSPNRRGVK
eukprot:5854822-Prymnesium_polylepis.1